MSKFFEVVLDYVGHFWGVAKEIAKEILVWTESYGVATEFHSDYLELREQRQNSRARKYQKSVWLCWGMAFLSEISIIIILLY